MEDIESWRAQDRVTTLCRLVAYMHGFAPRGKHELHRRDVTWEMLWKDDAVILYSRLRSKAYEIKVTPQISLYKTIAILCKCWRDIASNDFCLTNTFTILPARKHKDDLSWVSFWDLSQICASYINCTGMKYYPETSHFTLQCKHCMFRVVLSGSSIAFSCQSCGILGTTSRFQRKRQMISPATQTILFIIQFLEGHLYGVERR